MARKSPSPPRPARTIETTADVAAGVRALKRVCPAMARAHALTGDPPLRRWSPGLPGLVRIIVGQQLSTASANAIHTRLSAAVGPLDAAALAACPDDTLRAAGLSGPKIKTLRALGLAVSEGHLDLDTLASADIECVRTMLTSIGGIGPWTADIYLMFCRGDADAFAPGDLALQIGAARLFQHEARPTPAELTQIAERWRPWRGIAARLIWAYYGAVKSAAR